MPPARPRPRAQLSPDAIIDAATRITASSGAAGLTVRRLGHHLGADPTAIYRHFRDKDEILLEVADRLPDDVGWRDRMEWIARQTVDAFIAHPAIGVAMASRTTRREGEFRIVEAILGALREAGLSDGDVVLYHRTFGDTVLAYGGMLASYAMLDPATRSRDESAWSLEYLRASPSDYPNIAAVAPLLATVGDPVVLDTLIRVLLDAIERRAAGE